MEKSIIAFVISASLLVSGCKNNNQSRTALPANPTNTYVVPIATQQPASFNLTLQPSVFPNGEPCMWGQYSPQEGVVATIIIAEFQNQLYTTMRIDNEGYEIYFGHTISDFNAPDIATFKMGEDEITSEFWNSITRGNMCNSEFEFEKELGT